MKLTRTGIVIVGAVVIATAVGFALQHRALENLRADNQSMRGQLDSLAPLRAENERLSSALAEAAKQPALVEAQLRELAKLRGEVTRLRGQIAEATNESAKLGAQNLEITSEISQLLAQRGQIRTTPTAQPVQFQAHTSAAIFPAAADSIEGQLDSQDKRWEPTQGQIQVGSYVQDILQGRLDQPEGRGRIGKVISTDLDANGRDLAIVDFGRGLSEPIFFSELAPIQFVP